MQYAASLQHELWGKVAAVLDSALRPFAALEESLRALRDSAASFEAPKSSHAMTDEAVGQTVDVPGKAMQRTY
jgi:hypothetical protein